MRLVWMLRKFINAEGLKLGLKFLVLLVMLQTAVIPSSISSNLGTHRHNPFSQSIPFLVTQHSISVRKLDSCSYRQQKLLLCKSKNRGKPPCCLSESSSSYNASDPEHKSNSDSEARVGNEHSARVGVEGTEERSFPKTIPKKPRRGRKSEAVLVEDFIRNSLEQTFASIREKCSESEVPENMENVMKGVIDEENDSEMNDSDDKNDDAGKKGKRMVVEDESKSWPLDADVGWGIRASEYFDEHSIKNTVGEDGVEIDWEGEMDECWVKEINCLEWEDFAFHPSPLIVLVFERYNRASDNWKVLKELEKAAKVYWENENCLPPRTVKIDINIERDLAYALKVKEGPELLFLRGNRIIFREKKYRTSDELVKMIAHFYYKAKKPAWI
ncbi:unnamed protein product [Rhodiola kirilowii]